MAIHKHIFWVSVNGKDELDQIEAAFKRAGYRWYYTDCHRQALANNVVALFSDGDVFGCSAGSSTPMPFAEGLALLESLAEPVKPATFKVGDRVRIVRKAGRCWTDGMTKTISQYGTVIKGCNLCPPHVPVKTDAGEWFYPPESLELIAEPEAKPEPVATLTDNITGTAYPITEGPFGPWDSVSAIPVTDSAMDRLGVKPTSSYGFTQKTIDEITDLLNDPKKETSMSETKIDITAPTIERRIALATGRILWRAAWPVRKLFRGVAKGAVNMFYAGLFGGVCYGGYELYQFLQAIKITLPE